MNGFKAGIQYILVFLEMQQSKSLKTLVLSRQNYVIEKVIFYFQDKTSTQEAIAQTSPIIGYCRNRRVTRYRKLIDLVVSHNLVAYSIFCALCFEL